MGHNLQFVYRKGYVSVKSVKSDQVFETFCLCLHVDSGCDGALIQRDKCVSIKILSIYL